MKGRPIRLLYRLFPPFTMREAKNSVPPLPTGPDGQVDTSADTPHLQKGGESAPDAGSTDPGVPGGTAL